MAAAETLKARMWSQGLAEPRATDVAGVFAQVFALQAQSLPALRLAVRARTTGLTADDVDAAAGSAYLCTWAMRGTLHALPVKDIGWVVGLLGEANAAAGKGRRAQLGLDEKTCERGLAAIQEMLSGGVPLTKAELSDRVGLDAKSQAPVHLFAFAANRGLICRGPDEGTYVRMPGGGKRLAGDDALAELAGRYLAGHAPAAAEDFAAWSGLPITRARHAVSLVPSEGETEAGGERVVRLLGAYDEYLLGYRERAVDARHAKRIQAGGGIIRPAVVVDGRIVGTWRHERHGKQLTVTVEPFGALPRGCRAEVTDIGRFLGTPATMA